jgi:hypothetical protein
VGDLIEAGGIRPRLPVAQRAESPAKPVSEMTSTEKLVQAFKLARIDDAVRAKILAVLSPEALAAAIIAFAVVFLASQVTPVGWAADLGIAISVVFVGTALFAAIRHLVNFAEARNATTPEQLDQAGQEFAAAIAEIEVDAVILLVTHGIGGGRGGTPPEGPNTSGGLVLATAGGGGRVVPVVVDTIPESVRAGALLMSRAEKKGGPQGAASGGSGRKTPGLKDGPPPEFEIGEIKPVKSYKAGLYQLSGRGAKGNDVLVTFDDAGKVHMQVFGERTPGVKTIIWEDEIGQVTPPTTARPGSTQFGDLMEPLVRDLVSRVTGIKFNVKASNAGGPDLVPTPK